MSVKLFLVYLSLLVFSYLFGVDNYVNIISNNTNEYAGMDLGHSQFIDKRGDTISLSALEEKILVLDFWSTNCGICYEKFPEFNSRSKKYLDDSRIRFISIHMPSKRDSLEKSMELLNNYNYTFDELFSFDIDEAERIGIHYYPQYLVLDENHKIQYAGNMNTDWNDFVYNFDEIINKALDR